MTTSFSTRMPSALLSAQPVGPDGFTDAERERLEAAFLREPSDATHEFLAAWRARKRVA